MSINPITLAINANKLKPFPRYLSLLRDILLKLMMASSMAVQKVIAARGPGRK
jgi:hypothetical protein